MTVRERTEKVVLRAMQDTNQQLPPQSRLEISLEAVLFGPSGRLDSLGLVNLIMEVEQGIQDEFSNSITLADEKALSQKNSPFLTARTLIDYVVTLLEAR